MTKALSVQKYDYDHAIAQLKRHANKRNLAGMRRFAIPADLGVTMPQLRAIAKKLGKNHALAQKLFSTKLHEAKLLAVLVDEPARVTEKQFEQWACEFRSWDLCDVCCGNLFDKTSFAYAKAFEYSKRKEEFVKRTGFTLMATLAVHEKTASDAKLAKFLPVIKREAHDNRNFVKKAVNWALRQIGKRNKRLNKLAIATAKEIRKQGTPPARWIASNALSELESKAVQKRLKAKP